ncbi:MAG: hypothetical protein HPY65_18975 [Syntrophaceae bacterium]|nr:hypothetical protein [Syntrophaceae bacterium]
MKTKKGQPKRNKTRQKGLKKGESTRSRQLTFLKAFLDERFCIVAACRVAGINRATFYRWKENERFRKELDALEQEKVDLIEAALFRNVQAGDSTSIIFALKRLGRKRGYGDKPMPSKEGIAIIRLVRAGEISLKDGAYQLHEIGEPLPEAMKIELEKMPPDVPPPELPPAMSDEELEERYQKGLARQNQQRDEFVPNRREEVQAIKDGLRGIESFGPDADMRTGESGQSQE